ncbi:MAG: transketolase [Rectinema sp.]
MIISRQEQLAIASRALAMRGDVLRMVKASGAGHMGGALSAADLMAVLFFRVLHLDPANPRMENRDRFVLSAGHKCLILYAALAERGFFPKELFDSYGALDSHLPGHPSMAKLPGVEANTGSLGHGLSIAAGMAMGLRFAASPAKVFTLMGDGELAEGSNWEAAAAASQHRLDTLTAIVDRNRLQIGGKTTDVMSYEPLEERWASFGWSVRRIDGHDISAIASAFDALPFEKGKPSVIIADTIKSKGFSFAENKAAYHYWKATAEEIGLAEADLEKAESELAAMAGGIL